MFPELGVTLPWFMAASTLVLLAYVLVGGRKSHVDQRLGELSAAGRMGAGADAAKLVENRAEQWMNRRVRREEKKLKLKDRLRQAGLYKDRAIPFFLATRVMMGVGPALAGYFLSRAGYVSLTQGLLLGGAVGLFGTLAPSFWLDHVKRARQTKVRRALPDAMDVMAVCLEGGMSLSGSLSKVSHELASAHPMLAVEFQIVERQTQMGRTTGEALKEMAKRFDLEELRSLAAVVIQAERIGSSVSDALEVFADTLRLRRHQRAEEMAQKAAIKILFPTLLFIFPGIFVVILGPAAIQIYEKVIKGALAG